MRCSVSIARPICLFSPCRTAWNGDRDGVPNVLVEASSQRLPCISTTVPGVLELLSNEESAILVPPDDTIALASAIKRLAADPAFGAVGAVSRATGEAGLRLPLEHRFPARPAPAWS